MSRNGHRQTRVDLNSLKNLKEWSDRKLCQEIEEGEKACGLISENEVKESERSSVSEKSSSHEQEPFRTETETKMGKKSVKTGMDEDEDDEEDFQALMRRIRSAEIQPISEKEFDRRRETVKKITEDSSGIPRYGLAKKMSVLRDERFCPKKMCLFTKRRRGPQIQSKSTVQIKSRNSFLERDEILDLAEEVMRIQDWTEEFQRTVTQTRTADNPVSTNMHPAVTAGSQKHEASPAVVISGEVKEKTPSFHPNHPRKHLFRKKRMKILLVAVAAGIAALGGTMVASGKREYNYGIYPIVGKQNLVMKNNAVLDTADNLEAAYQRIEDELGIPVLEVGHLLDGMEFTNLSMKRNIAIIEFQYQDKYIYLREEKKLFSKETFQSKVSDRVPYFEIYNKLLNKNIVIEKNVLQDNLVEYSAQIEERDAEYYLSGMVNEKEFLTILEGLMFR